MTPPPELNARVIESAIERGEIILHYQPQYTADGATIASCEALVRWQHPSLGLLGPSMFLAEANRLGLAAKLTRAAIERVCQEAQAWGDLPVAVNVPPEEFADTGFVESVRTTLERYSFPPERLEIEIVETSVFGNDEAAEATIEALRALGMRVALDDFGTGYSSLSLLRRLPIDKVKIDKSFVDDITSIKSASIVHAVIALARAIGLKITAEGVETADQQKFLRIAGCHYLQGYFLSRPLPPESLTDLLAQHRRAMPARLRS